MKRMSIAEQTLKKQIDALLEQERILCARADDISVQIKTTEKIRFQLEAEKAKLEADRKTASERNKP